MAAPASDRRDTTPDARQYGVLECGCEWESAGATLVLVHGRDREPVELIDAVLAARGSETLRILAPWVAPRCWYDGRYDDPLHETSPGRDAGLAVIGAAISTAVDRGTGPVFLAGFSQGGCMVAEYLLARGGAELAGACIFTGSILSPDAARRSVAVFDDLPVILSGGTGDTWLPSADLKRTGAILEARGAQVELMTFDDQDHVVRPAEIESLLALVSRRSLAASSPAGRDASHPPAL